MKKKENIKNISSGNENSVSYQQPKFENVSNNNRNSIVGLSNCDKTYQMNYILIQKQEPIYIITKSLSQYPNIKAQTSDEVQPLENYGNSTAVFD